MIYSPTIISILEVLLVLIPVLLAVAFVTVAERKTTASMQRRLGPNIVGYYRLLQPITDALKLIIKEYISPTKANIVLFFIGPLIALISSLLGYAVVPYGPGLAIWDFNLGILYMLAVSLLITYGILLAGWSYNSKYTFLNSIIYTVASIFFLKRKAFLSYSLTVKFISNLFSRLSPDYVRRLILRSIIFRSFIAVFSFIVVYIGLLEAYLLNPIIIAGLLIYYLYRICIRSREVHIIYAICELVLILGFLAFFWYAVGLFVCCTLAIPFDIGIDKGIVKSSDEHDSNSEDASYEHDSGGEDASGENYDNDETTSTHSEAPSDSNSPDNGSDNNHWSGDDGNNDRDSNSPGIPEPMPEHAQCPCSSMGEYPDLSDESINETLCDYNPERNPDGTFEHHNAFKDGKIAYFCGNCHKVSCFECQNPDYPEGYSQTNSDDSPDRPYVASQYTWPNYHDNPEAGPSNWAGNTSESSSQKSSKDDDDDGDDS